MSLKQKAAELRAQVEQKIAEYGDGMTAEQFTEVKGLRDEAAGIMEQLKRGEAAQELLAGLGAKGDEQHVSPGYTTERKSLIERFVEGTAYQGFKSNHPSGVGQGTEFRIEKTNVGSMKDFLTQRKALIGSPIAQAQPQEFPLVDLVERPALTLLDLVSRGSMASDMIRYVQIESVTRNGAIVAEAIDDAGTTAATGLKPTSDFETTTETAEAFTYADGYTVTNQLLADHPAFATFMTNELRYSLPALVEDYLLNGSGAAGQPRGILNTTGVQQQTYVQAATHEGDLAFLEGIRKGITKVTRLRGGTVQAILLSPEDDERLDLMRDTNDRFYGQGPFQSGPQTVWGRPRVVSEALTPGQVVLGDFRQVALLDREGLSITAFNQHKDYAQRNLVYVRAELRAAQAIWRPNRLVVVKRAA